MGVQGRALALPLLDWELAMNGAGPIELPAPVAPGAPLPWWAKMLAKIVLRRVVPHYRWRRRLGIGVHSFSADTAGHPGAIAREVAWFREQTGRGPRGLLELGPGDSIANAIFARAQGIERIWLMDAGDFASHDMAAYRRIAERAGVGGLDFSGRDGLLASLGATYLTGGVASLAAIPDGVVDLSVSYTVLEHVRRGEFAALMGALYRVTAPGGAGNHAVDLMDHLGGRLNNLRLGDWIWERDWVAGSGFYTNRLGRDEIRAAAEAAGFATGVRYVARWAEVPTARRVMTARFRERPDEALRVAMFGLDLRR